MVAKKRYTRLCFMQTHGYGPASQLMDLFKGCLRTRICSRPGQDCSWMDLLRYHNL
uniref:Uncharacterized protein n=1 Tax=Picea glauca TaxID=3330 RepID=A0A101M0M0_PICGL|nr:hypothetical protein ABT39_MTgene4162 [Picea glauca]QHR89017.1 hypothetical protein Q903MT_gene3036 [Picea sitchensis]